MLERLDRQLAAALDRVHKAIDVKTEWAHVERREKLESARRSLGQRIRWARWAIFGPVCMPAVFRFRNKES